jgi:hypothetical protein
MRDDLRARIAASLRPVRPFWPARRRAALLASAALLALAAVPGLMGVRGDLTTVGPWLAWGGSLAQFAVAVALIAAAMREAVPADAVAGSAARLLLATGAAVTVVLALATNIVSPEAVARVETFADWMYCWQGAVLAGLPLVVLTAALVARGLPMRPGLAGALGGMGAGAAVDGGWRLFCGYSNPFHVIASHGGGVLTLTIAGALLGWAVAIVSRRR